MSIHQIEMEMIMLLLKRANQAQRDSISDLLAATKSVEQSNGTTQTINSIGRPFRIGDRVIFTGRKTKPPVIGTIKSMNDKTYTITDCSDGGPGWRINPGMLKHYVAAA